MSHLDLALLAVTGTGASLGVWAIWWARASVNSARTAWGRWLFVCILVCFGVAGLVAAGFLADGLAPLGLCAGLLVVGMLWEPAPALVSVTTTDIAPQTLDSLPK